MNPPDALASPDVQSVLSAGAAVLATAVQSMAALYATVIAEVLWEVTPRSVDGTAQPLTVTVTCWLKLVTLESNPEPESSIVKLKLGLVSLVRVPSAGDTFVIVGAVASMVAVVELIKAPVAPVLAFLAS